jgi:hypothetical protein
MKTENKSYVYTYQLGDQIIYVGIGTHSNAEYDSFPRAKQFSLHPEVYRLYRDQLDN